MAWISGNRYLSASEMKNNAQIIMDYLLTKGWTKNAISGMLGNMQTESGCNPGIWESLTVNWSRGYGLVQWTPATKLRDWCSSKGLDYTQGDSQLQRILYEVTDRSTNRQWWETSSYNFTFETFTKSTQSPEYLASAFLRNYERPASFDTENTRRSQARTWYNTLTSSSDVIEKAVSWARQIAADDTHGYSQNSRWGPDYDCSSLLIQAWQNAGVPVKTAGATYTGNMRTVFLNNGFEDVTSQVNLSTGSGLQYGDVLLNIVHHTAMYIGNGRVVQASSDRGYPQTGDQTGTEIWETTYQNYPYDCVLRYGSGSVTPPEPTGVSLIQWIPA